jgi:ETC complex I subunit conserved region
MTAKIYKPARTAMQSGSAKTKGWLLEFEPEQPRSIEPLMGWTSSGDMKQQIKLRFDTKEEAIAYADRNGIAYQVFEPHETAPKVLSYSDNFKVSRVGQWTH